MIFLYRQEIFVEVGVSLRGISLFDFVHYVLLLLGMFLFLLLQLDSTQLFVND